MFHISDGFQRIFDLFGHVGFVLPLEPFLLLRTKIRFFEKVSIITSSRQIRNTLGNQTSFWRCWFEDFRRVWGQGLQGSQKRIDGLDSQRMLENRWFDETWMKTINTANIVRLENTWNILLFLGIVILHFAYSFTLKGFLVCQMCHKQVHFHNLIDFCF